MKDRVDAFELELEQPEEGGCYPCCLNCCGEYFGRFRCNNKILKKNKM